jgi:hypothetical protein
LQLSTGVQKRAAFSLVIVSFADAHASRRSSLVPLTTMGPLSASKPASRSPWTSGGGVTPFRRLRLLRSLAPLASPFAPSQVTSRRRLLLSWVYAPLKLDRLRLDSSDLLELESSSTRQRSEIRSRADPKAETLTRFRSPCHARRLAHDPTRRPDRSLTFDHRATLADSLTARPEGQTDHSSPIACYARRLAHSPTRRPNRSLVADRPEQPPARSQPDPKAKLLTHSQLQQTASSSLTARPEGQTAHALSAAANNLQLTHAPTRRPKRSLALSCSKQPPAHSRPDPKARPLTRSQLQQTPSRSLTTQPEGQTAHSLSDADDVLESAHSPTRRLDRSLALRRSIALQLTHSPTRRSNHSLAFGRSRRPQAHSQLDPEVEPLTRPWLLETPAGPLTTQPKSRAAHSPLAASRHPPSHSRSNPKIEPITPHWPPTPRHCRDLTTPAAG